MGDDTLKKPRISTGHEFNKLMREVNIQDFQIASNPRLFHINHTESDELVNILSNQSIALVRMGDASARKLANFNQGVLEIKFNDADVNKSLSRTINEVEQH